ncbi:SAV_6107 family HEPN domain-containing protein [Actinoalloteichus spitiensis]|uniref:SAV_6107 family HEPN domain-containing protein n=1 Tax=Actinoalloteichus spitiensis TaxID=252394 RepID=UPI00037FB20B|nr:SAV_6107 family HEPN domain-containing protein [Actinoalloteichus spitiensis]
MSTSAHRRTDLVPGPAPGPSCGRGLRPGPLPATTPPDAPTSLAVEQLLRRARSALDEAARASAPARRYSAAYLAAVQGAAALVAARARPSVVRGPTSVWVLLTDAAPELGGWATFFQSCSDRRAAVDAGVHRLAHQRAADELLHRTDQFLTLIDSTLRVRPRTGKVGA